eukprot:GHVQ01030446.1.p1 GENE.GHVQ01030446.1~~GHVQ01030446.1.p1  ORF type:complete len:100 (-),score=19.36 GHVQ01030446.1:137-436(-)
MLSLVVCIYHHSCNNQIHTPPFGGVVCLFVVSCHTASVCCMFVTYVVVLSDLVSRASFFVSGLVDICVFKFMYSSSTAGVASCVDCLFVLCVLLCIIQY